jgi:3-deoxy-manno-octulosonate cytidylyltransferase (CMP-KDO synthetase)
MKTIAVVASRYASTRFPGKALADINGRPMVWWVYEQAKKAQKVDIVVVATDDIRIEGVCQKYDMNVIMTSPAHKTTANRMYEVSQNMYADFYLTINGDEPLIEPEAIDAAVPEFVPQNIEFGTNTIAIMKDAVDVMDPTNIKVVFDQNHKALYMSRTPIPFPYAGLKYQYYKHIGVIGYNKKMLEFYHNSEPGYLERTEGIDTLRFLDYGLHLQFCEAQISTTISVDTPKDLLKVLEYMKQNKS